MSEIGVSAAGAARSVGRLQRPGAVKVPAITAAFWAIKVLSTAMGESTSDFLNHRFDPVLVVAACALVFVAALAWQVAADRYRPLGYWLTVVMVSVFGTMCADVLHVAIGVPYAVSTVFFAVLLAGLLLAWRSVEGTLSVHSIATPRRELFYWATVVTTFALGTAAGDLTASSLGLGYFGSGLLFTAAIAVPAVLAGTTGLSRVTLFWAAYILTRPVGASFADWIGVGHDRGGLAVGTGTISLILAAAIVGLVGVAAPPAARSLSAAAAPAA